MAEEVEDPPEDEPRGKMQGMVPASPQPPAPPPESGDDAPLSFTEDELVRIRALPRAKKLEIAAECLVAGMQKRQAAEVVGVDPSQISRWFDSNREEAREAIHGAVKTRALLEVPKNLNLLISLRDKSFNAETRRKAILDLQRMADMPIDPNSGSTAAALQIVGNRNQIQVLAVPALQERIMKIAGALGADAVNLAKEEMGQHARLVEARPKPEPGRAPNAGGGVSGAAPGVEKAEGRKAD